MKYVVAVLIVAWKQAVGGKKFRGVFYFLTVFGNGHQWHAPATRLFWDFFKQHRSCGNVTDALESSPGNQPLEIYPNPVSDALFIRYGGDTEYTVSVFNPGGQLLFQGKNVRNINAALWKTGVYLLKFDTENQLIIRKIAVP